MTDTTISAQQIYVSQGDIAVSDNPEVVISAVLGSCIAVCLWDPGAGVGGMNHVLLPDSHTDTTGAMRFGAFEMERLINGMVHDGAVRDRLVARVFGGASMMNGLSDIGRRNVEFVSAFLDRESIPQKRGSVGGSRARRVRFWPASGRAQQRFVTAAPPMERAQVLPSNDVELF